MATNDVVVVGVSGLQPGRKAKRLLDEQKVPYRYLEYGSYFSGWRRRLALKMWLGWPTFPLVFIKGTFVGGASDVERLIASGELPKLVSGPRAELIVARRLRSVRGRADDVAAEQVTSSTASSHVAEADAGIGCGLSPQRS